MSSSVNPLSPTIFLHNRLRYPTMNFLKAFFSAHPNLMEPTVLLCAFLLAVLPQLLVLLIGMALLGTR